MTTSMGCTSQTLCRATVPMHTLEVVGGRQSSKSELTTATFAVNGSNKKRKRMTVRFASCEDVHYIESHKEMTKSEIRKTWWKQQELQNMKPDSFELHEWHQKCNSKRCIRGLEKRYWTAELFDCNQDEYIYPEDLCQNVELYKYVTEFIPPQRPNVRPLIRSKDNQGTANDSNNNTSSSTTTMEFKPSFALYNHYMNQSQERARALALMDEFYVMEHVYGLSCSHSIPASSSPVIWNDDQWSLLRCCSCHLHDSQKKNETSKLRYGILPTLRFIRKQVCNGIGRKVAVVS